MTRRTEPAESHSHLLHLTSSPRLQHFSPRQRCQPLYLLSVPPLSPPLPPSSPKISPSQPHQGAPSQGAWAPLLTQICILGLRHAYSLSITSLSPPGRLASRCSLASTSAESHRRHRAGSSSVSPRSHHPLPSLLGMTDPAPVLVDRERFAVRSVAHPMHLTPTHPCIYWQGCSRYPGHPRWCSLLVCCEGAVWVRSNVGGVYPSYLLRTQGLIC
ncbi:hypothetical protein LX32DRAFT_357647 [Colletotrichum zoysiae]|uniref:Uncharacterized protein n=1 Tax=Colletotrichum zoysiae TaxID=1216348 RepID=A0AAD9HJX1_9PEZI|nr:hypothetical protein LX32DRAFT_357647 [Colletotrichum zoysiae]